MTCLPGQLALIVSVPASQVDPCLVLKVCNEGACHCASLHGIFIYSLNNMLCSARPLHRMCNFLYMCGRRSWHEAGTWWCVVGHLRCKSCRSSLPSPGCKPAKQVAARPPSTGRPEDAQT